MMYIIGDWEFQTSFDVLDAAIEDGLTINAPGFLDFTRESLTPASVIYHLRQEQLGDLGSIKLIKRNDTLTLLGIFSPGISGIRAATPEENAAIHALPSKEEKRQAWVTLIGKLQADRDQLDQRRGEHQRAVINSLFYYLESEKVITITPKAVVMVTLIRRGTPQKFVEWLEKETYGLHSRQFPEGAEGPLV